THLSQAKTQASQDLQNQESKLKQELMNAQVKLEAAKLDAQSIVARAEGEAGVIEKQNDAEIAGLKRAAQAFNNPQQFAQYHVLAKLAPALSEIFASDDSDFARMLSAYLTSPTTNTMPPTATDTQRNLTRPASSSSVPK